MLFDFFFFPKIVYFVDKQSSQSLTTEIWKLLTALDAFFNVISARAVQKRDWTPFFWRARAQRNESRKKSVQTVLQVLHRNRIFQFQTNTREQPVAFPTKPQPNEKIFSSVFPWSAQDLKRKSNDDDDVCLEKATPEIFFATTPDSRMNTPRPQPCRAELGRRPRNAYFFPSVRPGDSGGARTLGGSGSAFGSTMKDDGASALTPLQNSEKRRSWEHNWLFHT